MGNQRLRHTATIVFVESTTLQTLLMFPLEKPAKSRTNPLLRRFASCLGIGLVLLVTPTQATPIAHWSLDGATITERLIESYGTATLDASQVGTNTWSTRTGFGDILANGVNSNYLSVPNTGALNFGTGDFSISIWIRRTSNSGATAGIVDALNNTGTGFQLLFRNTDQARLRLDDNLGATVNCDIGTAHLHLNAWQHLVATVDRSTNRVKLYINGSADNATGIDISSLTGSINPDQALWIGNLNGNIPANGQLDDLAFFDRLLTPAEIAALNTSGGTPILTVFPPAAPSVTIDPAGGVLHSGDNITLSTDAGFDIRYSLDGTNPDHASTTYSSPLTLGASAELRARSSNGVDLGPIASANFLILPPSPPNIVLIIGDDIGFNDLGCYGAPSVATPRLDALAAVGCRHPQFTTTGPGDLASQYALLTGRLPRRAGLPTSLATGTPGLDSREWTLAEVLRKAGYETAFIGAWHLGDPPASSANNQGFILFHGLPAAPALAPLSENGSILDPSPDPATLLNTFATRAETFLQAQSTAPFFLVFQPTALTATGTSLLGDYGNQIEALDTAAGRILDQLDSLGITNNTLVLFLSDEGADRNTSTFPTGSNGQLRDGKGTTWEGGVRTPFISSWPAIIPAGTTSYQTLWLPDLHASLAALVNGYLPTDRPLDSTERLAALLCVDSTPDTAPLFLHRHNGSSYELRTVRQGQWKLHQAYNNEDPENTTSASTPLLYDLLVDPTERINRSSTQTGLVTTLQSLATTHEATFTSPVPQLPPVQEAFLSIPLHAFPSGANSLTYTFTRPADSLHDHYLVQHGTDLQTWTGLPSADFVSSVTPGSGATESVLLTIPLDHPDLTGPERFIRLKANRP